MHLETLVWPSMWVAVCSKGIFRSLFCHLPCHHTSSLPLQNYNLFFNLDRPMCTHTVTTFFFILPPTEIIRAERIHVRDVSTNSATLQWRPVLSGLRGHYEIRFGPVPTVGTGGFVGVGPGTSPSTDSGHYQRLTQPADSSSARLTNLKPDTTYIAELIPQSNELDFKKLSVTFTTKPGWVKS